MMNPEEVEEKTFRNAVDFERENLLRIVNGELATVIFSSHRRMYLFKHGILVRGGYEVRTRRAVPTQRAMKILEEEA